ncbi:MAG: geranylgeranyl reductase family protein [Candidatus Aminicenantes bacterium]|nr:geranylgeranyl reductase family protein [Candidatus Aminicenantes bacterium]NIM78935.1 geranylgeranyl reductase family protein [Candidatus Aminicenantes bacterium]NIN18195.1 geranylgeranyl reductase family protein [Candidatus Aminicenantes bacterium]NIN42094.1 geranylgeranyl reductase family protein [Candidatus Aminicenantes bacterium]NIN84847.1 geranylgeranyl reductase family protein [Candidatus Aminicenantes bacterium]
MMQTKSSHTHDNYDVAVAGAGPAGSTAAYVLGKKGYKVALLDKETFPRKKLCGGCLTAKTLRLLNRLFQEPEESLTQKNIINFKSNRFEIRYKTKTLIHKPSALTFYFVDRATYDTFLLQKAKQAGANVIEGEKVNQLELNTEANTYKITTSRNRVINARFIIGADGANSTIRTKYFQQAKLNTRWHHNLAYCLEVFPPREGNLHSLEYPILSFGYLRYGYAWLFPNKDRLVVGMGGLHRKNKDLKAAFKAFLDDYHISNTDMSNLKGHPLPYGNFLKKPIQGNLLLVGDAAGLVDPMLGEGIYQAHKSGELAAQAIIEKLENNTDLEANYLNLLYTHLLLDFIYARKWRWFVYHPLNYILKFCSTKMVKPYVDKLAQLVHGDRTYRWFKKKKNFF